MSLVIRYDYAADIRNHKFDEVAKILREGTLTPEERNLLADYLEGKLKRPTGRPANDTVTLAEHMYSEYRSLRQYGRTSEEVGSFISSSYTEHNRNPLKLLQGQGMKRKDAIRRLAEIEVMGEKNVERLVDIGKKFYDIDMERQAKEWGGE